MGKKTVSELIWNSRIILPEHREAMIELEIEQSKRKKPIFDEQQLNEFAYVLLESLMERKQVKIILFDEYDDIEIKGVVSKIDQTARKIRIDTKNDIEWVKIDDIIDIFFV